MTHEPPRTRTTRVLSVVVGLAVLGCGTDGAPARPQVDVVAIPAAAFSMGCDSARDPQCAPTERPVHRVSVARFAIDRDEVTNAAYAECVSAGACTPPSTGLVPTESARRPVGNVT